MSQGYRIGAKARAVFLEALRLSPNVTAAAAAGGHNRRAFYRVRDRDRGFREAWDAAIAEAFDRLEGEAYEVATRGALEEVFDANGDLVSSRRRQDPQMIRFLLSARKPEVYSEKQRIEVGGRVDVEHQLADGRIISIGEVLAAHRALEAGATAVEIVGVEDEEILDDAEVDA